MSPPQLFVAASCWLLLYAASCCCRQLFRFTRALSRLAASRLSPPARSRLSPSCASCRSFCHCTIGLRRQLFGLSLPAFCLPPPALVPPTLCRRRQFFGTYLFVSSSCISHSRVRVYGVYCSIGIPRVAGVCGIPVCNMALLKKCCRTQRRAVKYTMRYDTIRLQYHGITS